MSNLYLPATLSTVDDLIWAIRNGDPHNLVSAAVMRMTKETLEDHPADILTIAVTNRNSQVVYALLVKGLRSGHALDAAVYSRDRGIVEQLLHTCEPSMGAEQLAVRLHELDIAAAIRAKRADREDFRTNADF